MSLFNFRHEGYKLHSGALSPFIIDCNALSNDDIEALAWMAARLVGSFRQVEGIPRGGLRLAEALKRYRNLDGPNRVLLVDDVLTTGNSMREERTQIVTWGVEEPPPEVVGVVIWARGVAPSWIKVINQLPAELFLDKLTAPQQGQA